MKKKDFVIVTVVGLLIGLFALFPIENIGAARGFFLSVPVAVVIVLGCAVFAPVALSILHVLSRKMPVFERFGKFAAIGTLNTMIDLSVLNGLTLLTGLSAGVAFFGFKATSFIIATTNSYFWNKFWTFQSNLPVTFKEYMRFAAFTLVGALVNAGVASLVKLFIGTSMPAGLAVNVAALVAVAASFLFNFLAYNNIVFKKKAVPEAV